MRSARFRVGAQICEVLHLDPAQYFTETDPYRNAIRDAAATVLAEIKAVQADEADRERERAARRKN